MRAKYLGMSRQPDHDPQTIFARPSLARTNLKASFGVGIVGTTRPHAAVSSVSDRVAGGWFSEAVAVGRDRAAGLVAKEEFSTEFAAPDAWTN
jgi:hypothetical protein